MLISAKAEIEQEKKKAPKTTPETIALGAFIKSRLPEILHPDVGTVRADAHFDFIAGEKVFIGVEENQTAIVSRNPRLAEMEGAAILSCTFRDFSSNNFSHKHTNTLHTNIYQVV